MKAFFVLWDSFVLILWADAEKTAQKCEAWHARLAARIDAKLNRK